MLTKLASPVARSMLCVEPHPTCATSAPYSLSQSPPTDSVLRSSVQLVAASTVWDHIQIALEAPHAHRPKALPAIQADSLQAIKSSHVTILHRNQGDVRDSSVQDACVPECQAEVQQELAAKPGTHTASAS